MFKVGDSVKLTKYWAVSIRRDWPTPLTIVNLAGTYQPFGKPNYWVVQTGRGDQFIVNEVYLEHA
jgi:hypothetical protein